LRAAYGDRFNAYSAGVEATEVDPRAAAVMKEIGIDISCHRSKSFQEFQDKIFNLAVTVCDHAREACPICTTELERPTIYPRGVKLFIGVLVIPAMQKDPGRAAKSIPPDQG